MLKLNILVFCLFSSGLVQDNSGVKGKCASLINEYIDP